MRSKILFVIAAADVCVVLHKQTRSYPGDSMKLWEYLACGRPVVATAGPGYGDTIEGMGCGLATKPDDPGDLARQLLYLLVDQELRNAMGERGRKAVLRSHTWAARAEQLEQVCHRAIGGMKPI
jgi:glycosyltransferase involved in cell wall biosynthesis